MQPSAPPFEPVAVQPRYPHPRATVNPDASKGWVRRMAPILRSHAPKLGLALGAAALSMVVRIQVPQVTMRAIDRALVPGVLATPGSSPEPLGGFVLQLVVMALAMGVLGSLFRYYLQRVAFEVDYDLRVLLFEQFHRLSFSFYDRAQTGQLVSRANSDIRALQIFLTFAPMMLVTTVTFFAALYLMVRIHALLTLVALVTSPLVFLTARTMRRSLFPISWMQAARQAEMATVVEENVAGSRIVKSFAAEREEISKLEKVAQRLRWVSIEQADNRARYGPVMQSLPRVALSILLLYGGWLVIDGQVTIGALLAFNAYVLMLQMPFMILGFILMMAQRASASALRIFELLDATPEIHDKPGAIDLVECLGDVELRDVTFAYADGPPVLRGFDLHLRPGETVAMVGRTGCGKSTVARLIPRFYDVSDGAVLMDGHDVRVLTLASLRSHVGLVLDDNFLFSDTIFDNVAFGRPDATFDDVVAATTAAGAHDFILRLPDGYDTVVGERGYTLSGGQRQRLAIARTLLVNPRILILDDATSSIDAHREQEIHGALRTLMAGRTTLIIAHRVSTIALADRVLLMDDGRIVADGTHEELMATVPLYAAVLAQAERADEEVGEPSEPDVPTRGHLERDPNPERPMRAIDVPIPVEGGGFEGMG